MGVGSPFTHKHISDIWVQQELNKDNVYEPRDPLPSRVWQPPQLLQAA